MDWKKITIRQITHGQKITEPGVYDMPMAWYHADCCDGPSISSTGLRKIDLETPLHYWTESPLNPERKISDADNVEAKHFRIGRAAHLLALEPAEFRKQIVGRPPAFDSWRTDASKKWRANEILAGKTVLDPPEMEQVRGVAERLKQHPLYKEGLFEGHIEKAIIWKDQKTGVWLKSRPDAIPFSAKMLVDLKVQADSSPKATANAVKSFGYDMQLALGGIGLKAVLEMEIEDYVLCAAEVKEPHAIHVATIPQEMIGFARRRIRRSLNTFATCLRLKQWPAWDAYDGKPVGLSKWEHETLELEVKSGSLKEEF